MVAISCCHEFYEQFARNHINDSTGSAEISFAVLFFLSIPPTLLTPFHVKKANWKLQDGIRWVGLMAKLPFSKTGSPPLPWILYRACWLVPALFWSLEPAVQRGNSLALVLTRGEKPR